MARKEPYYTSQRIRDVYSDEKVSKRFRIYSLSSGDQTTTLSPKALENAIESYNNEIARLKSPSCAVDEEDAKKAIERLEQAKKDAKKTFKDTLKALDENKEQTRVKFFKPAFMVAATQEEAFNLALSQIGHSGMFEAALRSFKNESGFAHIGYGVIDVTHYVTGSLFDYDDQKRAVSAYERAMSEIINPNKQFNLDIQKKYGENVAIAIAEDSYGLDGLIGKIKPSHIAHDSLHKLSTISRAIVYQINLKKSNLDSATVWHQNIYENRIYVNNPEYADEIRDIYNPLKIDDLAYGVRMRSDKIKNAIKDMLKKEIKQDRLSDEEYEQKIELAYTYFTDTVCSAQQSKKGEILSPQIPLEGTGLVGYGIIKEPLSKEDKSLFKLVDKFSKSNQDLVNDVRASAQHTYDALSKYEMFLIERDIKLSDLRQESLQQGLDNKFKMFKHPEYNRSMLEAFQYFYQASGNIDLLAIDPKDYDPQLFDLYRKEIYDGLTDEQIIQDIYKVFDLMNTLDKNSPNEKPTAEILTRMFEEKKFKEEKQNELDDLKKNKEFKFQEADKKLKNPELENDNVAQIIGFNPYSDEELAAAKIDETLTENNLQELPEGYYINEFGEIIRPENAEEIVQTEQSEESPQYNGSKDDNEELVQQ